MADDAHDDMIGVGLAFLVGADETLDTLEPSNLAATTQKIFDEAAAKLKSDEEYAKIAEERLAAEKRDPKSTAFPGVPKAKVADIPQPKKPVPAPKKAPAPPQTQRYAQPGPPQLPQQPPAEEPIDYAVWGSAAAVAVGVFWLATTLAGHSNTAVAVKT